MGFFKQVKDMKNMVHEAPNLIAQSSELAANAKAMAAAQQAAAGQAPTDVPGAAAITVVPGGDPGPINGVSIELYAEISRSFAEVGYDQSRGPELAGRKGVAPADWAAAMEGWNGRIATDPAVAKRFNSLYAGR
jgi:hypothetical protein